MEPIISKELVQTLEENYRIENVYFEKATGLHHFNHVKTVVQEGKEDLLTVNGKEVIRMTAKEVKGKYKSSDYSVAETDKEVKGKK